MAALMAKAEWEAKWAAELPVGCGAVQPQEVAARTPARASRALSGQGWSAEATSTADFEGEKKVTSVLTAGTEASARRPRALGFADVEAMKASVKSKLEKPQPYSVHNYYKTTGVWQKLARAALFENCTLIVIVANALFMYADTDFNPADTLTQSAPVFQVCEHFFCTYFTAEWVIRLMALEKLNGLIDAWFVFDGLLVAMMVMETWVLVIWAYSSGATGENPLGKETSVLRLIRLLRLSRLVRMFRSMPELMVLIRGMVAAMKSVLYVMGLLVLLTYVFAIALTQLSDNTYSGTHYFPTVPMAMLSLTTYATLQDNLTQFCDDIRSDSAFNLFLVLIFLALGFLTVLNMLVGVLCEVVDEVAQKEKAERQTQMIKEKFQDIVLKIDKDSNGKISYKEFVKIMDEPSALKSLQEVGVDPLVVVDFAEQIFMDKEGNQSELAFDRFMELLLELRDSNTATLKDIKILWQESGPRMKKALKDLDELNREMARNTERLDKMLGGLLLEVRALIAKATAE